MYLLVVNELLHECCSSERVKTYSIVILLAICSSNHPCLSSTSLVLGIQGDC
uniref:Uncharacterized protein n=1 Tax=Utricularia reniformis TaxID=192314 RepID=A0A1Y0B0J9_9LAMI|nr:hypothetical protein AEK19_MT0709 [Utricularia reniformis]ART30955.1 hypothetical protein AEK19_MT0709 [Utricularia reniformis]